MPRCENPSSQAAALSKEGRGRMLSQVLQRKLHYSEEMAQLFSCCGRESPLDPTLGAQSAGFARSRAEKGRRSCLLGSGCQIQPCEKPGRERERGGERKRGREGGRGGDREEGSQLLPHSDTFFHPAFQGQP